MNLFRRFAASLLSASALLAAPALAQPNFSSYVSIGDSLAAGFASGSLVRSHQTLSVPAHLSRAARVADFQQPLVAQPGLPPELALVSLLPAPTIAPKAALPGAPENLGLARPYNNLAVPGATVIDAVTRTTDNGGLHDLILRGRGTQLAQAVSLRPTFVTLWIGNNDVLGAALRGTAVSGVTLTPPAAFRQAYQTLVTALKNTGATIVAANLPDVTTIPYVTTVKPYLVDPATGRPVQVAGQNIPLIGPSGPLPASTLVTLAASAQLARGDGIPTVAGGRGTPLSADVILDAGEIGVIRDHVNENNRAIAEICQAADVPVLDINGILKEVASVGRTLGGVVLTNTFLSGGVFSYDGVHPTDLGYAVIANEWIGLINTRRAGTLPEVDLAPYFGVGTRSARPTGFEFTSDAQDSLLAVFPRIDAR